MASSELQISIQSLCFLSLVALFQHFSEVSAQPGFATQYYCEGTNFTSNSPYEDNLKQLLSLLPSKIESDNKFYNGSSGSEPDKVYGILLCRGDLNTEGCKLCAAAAVAQITQRCPNSKEYISWYDKCMFRYSNRNMFSVVEEKPEWTLYNKNNMTNQEAFHAIATQLMDGLVRIATTTNKGELFATGEVNFTSAQTIYGLVQCTLDITADECYRCLRNEVGNITNCCYGKQGAIVLRPSCNIRYEVYTFYASSTKQPPAPNSTTTPPAPNSTTTPEKTKKSNSALKVIIPVVISLMILVGLFIILWLKKKKKASTTLDDMDDITNVESLRFDLKTIKDATNNFSDVNKLGRGGFGFVYKGILPSGRELAVKRLSLNSEQGKKEFKTEIGLLVQLRHRNLVRLLGFCLEEGESILVYEFLPNGSLDQILFDPLKSVNLTWEIRYKIIGGIAKGTLYLHEDNRLTIIHRDLKASNVLLDKDMNAKISDFGMARLYEIDQTQGDSSKVVGTLGYIAPEYLLHGQISTKLDVYSFGVLLLEIITGKRINHFNKKEHAEDLLSYVWRNWQEETALEVIDETMRECFSANEVMKCIQIGLLSVQDVSERPTMSSVIQMLASEIITHLQVPSAPAVFHRGPILATITSQDDTSRGTRSDSSTHVTHPSSSSNQVSISEIIPR